MRTNCVKEVVKSETFFHFENNKEPVDYVALMFWCCKASQL